MKKFHLLILSVLVLTSGIKSEYTLQLIVPGGGLPTDGVRTELKNCHRVDSDYMILSGIKRPTDFMGTVELKEDELTLESNLTPDTDKLITAYDVAYSGFDGDDEYYFIAAGDKGLRIMKYKHGQISYGAWPGSFTAVNKALENKKITLIIKFAKGIQFFAWSDDENKLYSVNTEDGVPDGFAPDTGADVNLKRRSLKVMKQLGPAPFMYLGGDDSQGNVITVFEVSAFIEINLVALDKLNKITGLARGHGFFTMLCGGGDYYLSLVNYGDGTILYNLNTPEDKEVHQMKEVDYSPAVIIGTTNGLGIVTLLDMKYTRLWNQETTGFCYLNQYKNHNRGYILMSDPSASYIVRPYAYPTSTDCPISCKTCFEFDKDICLECESDDPKQFLLQEGQCVSACSPGYRVKNNYNGDSVSCERDRCYELGGKVYSTHYKDCYCPGDSIWSDLEKRCVNCQEKVPNCARCQYGEFVCERCMTGFQLKGRQECVSECAAENPGCALCMPGTKQCLACQNGFKLEEGKCVEEVCETDVENCLECDKIHAENATNLTDIGKLGCVTCKDNFVFNETKDCVECSLGIENCDICKNNTCSRCNYGYVLQNDTYCRKNHIKRVASIIFGIVTFSTSVISTSVLNSAVRIGQVFNFHTLADRNHTFTTRALLEISSDLPTKALGIRMMTGNPVTLDNKKDRLNEELPVKVQDSIDWPLQYLVLHLLVSFISLGLCYFISKKKMDSDIKFNLKKIFTRGKLFYMSLIAMMGIDFVLPSVMNISYGNEYSTGVIISSLICTIYLGLVLVRLGLRLPKQLDWESIGIKRVYQKTPMIYYRSIYLLSDIIKCYFCIFFRDHHQGQLLWIGLSHFSPLALWYYTRKLYVFDEDKTETLIMLSRELLALLSYFFAIFANSFFNPLLYVCIVGQLMVFLVQVGLSWFNFIKIVIKYRKNSKDSINFVHPNSSSEKVRFGLNFKIRLKDGNQNEIKKSKMNKVRFFIYSIDRIERR